MPLYYYYNKYITMNNFIRFDLDNLDTFDIDEFKSIILTSRRTTPFTIVKRPFFFYIFDLYNMEVDKYTFGIPTIDEPIHEEFFIQFRSAIIATCERWRKENSSDSNIFIVLISQC